VVVPSADFRPIPSIQVIAMHGWASDGTAWQPWQEAAEALGWRWQSGERGYGGLSPALPPWQTTGRRVVIAHSLGPHLLPPAVLAAAEAVVLLASFGRFVPPGRDSRRLRTALAGMAAQLEDPPTPEPSAEAEAATRAQAMLRTFLAEAAAPDPVALLPPGPADAPLGPSGRQRLRADLELLGRSTGLPAGFPPTAPVLIVEAGADRIVVPAAQALLRQALPHADVIRIEGAGHGLLRAPVVPLVLDWLQRLPRP
jgi:pimeloyl-[acyl-carrier protein] methyl ester esterase